jgi:hypothetical protein
VYWTNSLDELAGVGESHRHGTSSADHRARSPCAVGSSSAQRPVRFPPAVWFDGSLTEGVFTTNHSRLLAVLLSMLFLYQADATIVNVATPSIRAGLAASDAQLELVIGGYLLASATLLIIGARIGYLHG